MTLGDYNDRLLECGRCPLPYCEKPERECESKTAGYGAWSIFTDPAEGAGTPCQTRYLKKITTTVVTYAQSQSTELDPGFVQYTSSGSKTATLTEEVARSWYRQGLGACGDYPPANTRSCETTGSIVESYYSTRYVDGELVVYLSSQTTATVEASVGGTLIPGSSPPAFYAECVAKIAETVVETRINYEDESLYYVTNSRVYYSTGFVNAYGRTNSTSIVTTHAYESPFTHADWRAEVDADFAALDFEPIGEVFCGKAALCVAEAESDFYPCYSVTLTKVRLRWKIHKCSNYKYFRIEWDDVYFQPDWIPNPASYPNRMVNPLKDEAIAEAHRAWQWEGVSPTCDEGDEGNEFDDEDLWSPWGVVIVPTGGIGTVEMRNVMIQCYRGGYDGLWTPLPEYGIYVPPEDEP